MVNFFKILVLIIFINPIVSSGQFSLCYKDKINYLRKESKKIRSIDPKDNNFSDLRFLKPLLKDKRIVFLGEHYHSDGSTLQAKNRIVKYLHKELNFDVLLIELPIFSLHLKDRYVQNEDDLNRIMSTFFNFKISRHYSSLHKYIMSTKGSERPLVYQGFDIGVNFINVTYIKYLDSIFNSIDPGILKTEEWARFRNYLMNLNVEVDDINLNFNQFRKDTEYLQETLEKYELNSESYKFLSQILNSTVGAENFLINRPRGYSSVKNPYKDAGRDFDVDHLRDEQMAKNLLWYIEEMYPEKKIMVWASNYHIARNIDDVKRQDEYTDTAIPMGQYIYDKYKEKLFSIAFIGYKGKTGKEGMNYVKKYNITYPNGKKKVVRYKPVEVSKLIKPKKFSIEYLMSRTFHQYSFLNLREVGDEGKWLHQPIYMFPTFHKPFKTDWSIIYDGIFFIRTMEPDQMEYVENVTNKKIQNLELLRFLKPFTPRGQWSYSEGEWEEPDTSNQLLK